MIEAEMLLVTCGLAKKTISRKVSYLHHTYTWIRIVGESTFVLRKYDNSKGSGITMPRNLENQDGKAWASGPSSHQLANMHPKLDEFLGFEPRQEASDTSSPLGDIHLEDQHGKLDGALRLLYGVSETWLSLLSQMTRLANLMEKYSSGREAAGLSQLDWIEKRQRSLEDLVWKFVKSQQDHGEHQAQPGAGIERKSHEIPRAHLVQALNQALLIFFYRRIRGVNPNILQQYVDSVIQALRNFESTCKRNGIVSPGSPWPAFIAGCEALSRAQREYFSEWFETSLEITGFTRFKTIQSCMHEVWRRQDRNQASDGQAWTWMQVSKDQNMYIVLS